MKPPNKMINKQVFQILLIYFICLNVSKAQGVPFYGGAATRIEFPSLGNPAKWGKVKTELNLLFRIGENGTVDEVSLVYNSNPYKLNDKRINDLLTREEIDLLLLVNLSVVGWRFSPFIDGGGRQIFGLSRQYKYIFKRDKENRGCVEIFSDSCLMATSFPGFLMDDNKD